MPKRLPSSNRHLDRRQRHRCVLFLMESEHLHVVHLVDVIAGEHDHILWGLALDRIQVLVHRVGGALIPVLADPLLRRQNLDELAELLRDDTPTLSNVASERKRLVLCGDENVAQVRVDAVAENEVDDAVGPAEIDGRLGPFSRERRQPFARAAGQHDYQDLVVQHDSGISLVGMLPKPQPSQRFRVFDFVPPAPLSSRDSNNS